MSTARSNKASTNTLEGRLKGRERRGKLLEATSMHKGTFHSSSACHFLSLAQRCPTRPSLPVQSTWRCEVDGHKGTSPPVLHHSYRDAHILGDRQPETSFFSTAQNARFKNKRDAREPPWLGRLESLTTGKAHHCWRACQQGWSTLPSTFRGPMTALISEWLDGIRKYLKYLGTNYSFLWFEDTNCSQEERAGSWVSIDTGYSPKAQGDPTPWSNRASLP